MGGCWSRQGDGATDSGCAAADGTGHGSVTATQVADPGVALAAEPGVALLGDSGDTGVALPGDTGVDLPGDPGVALPGDPGVALPADPGVTVAADPGVALAADPGVARAGDAGVALTGDTGVALAADPGVALTADTGVALAADPDADIAGSTAGYPANRADARAGERSTRLAPALASAEQSAMPAKEAPNARRRKDSVDKKLLKGLQIFKRSKSKQSMSSTPSISAASADDSVASDDAAALRFSAADDPTGASEPADESASEPTSLAETSAAPAAEPQRKRSGTPISLSRIVGEVAESDTVTPGDPGNALTSTGMVDTPSPATPRSTDDTLSFDGINGELAEKLQTVEELERKIARMKVELDRAAERKRRQDEHDSKIIEALILEKMQGMGLLNNAQMADSGAEPVITLPDSPLANGPASGQNLKAGPLAKFGAAVSPTAADVVTTNAQITSNTAARIAKRSQVLQAHAAASTSSELKATLSPHGNTVTSQAHNFNRKLSQAQISGGGEAARPVAGTKLPTASGVSSAQAASANAVKALQSKGITSISSEKDVRQLAESFDQLKSLRSMDRLAGSLSMENLANGDPLKMDLGGSTANQGGSGASAGAGNQSNVNVFEQKQSFSSSNKKTVTNEFSTEEATANSEEMTRLQQGDSSFSENKASSDMRARLHMNGVTAEKGLFTQQEERHLRARDLSHDESRSAAAADVKLSTAEFSAEQKAMTEDAQQQTAAPGVFNTQQHSSASTHSKFFTKKQQAHVATPTSPAVAQAVEELDKLDLTTNPLDVSRALNRCSQQVSLLLHDLSSSQQEQQESAIEQMNVMLERAWRVPAYGRELGTSLSDVIRNNGGLDVLMETCNTGSKEMNLKSARVLGQCLTTTNRAYVVERGLNNVVESACRTCSENADEQESRVGSGILENLFKHNEGTCSDVVRLGGLDAVITQCRKKDVETLRHCASALANLSLYGGPENQEVMMKRKVPTWLFPLAFHNDENIKYYACLAIATMVANQQIEAAVLKSGTLDLVEPFVTSHDPDQFSKQTLTHLTGHSKNWLRRLVPVLFSKREEARKLAAFHFCMEAGAKVREGCPEVFKEIGAIEPLKQVASSPNAIASKYAAQALRLLGEEVPHKLSQQVPLWSVEDVKEWVKQIQFADYADAFERSRVDGDLLLRMSEGMLREDIGIHNGILRTRFVRELNNLKKMADYASCDSSGLNTFLQSVSPELSVYTYPMLSSGVDKDYLRYLTDEQLLHECNILNSIHRLRIHQAIKQEIAPPEPPDDMNKTLDCFISYRRSNGSQLASLLKVHLELRGFSVFIDVERLEAGKFDNNLLNSIRQAQNFILVLTQSALDRCISDYEQKDWVHKEAVAALQSKCNIIPIIENFQWPETERLPEDMQAITKFNGISWIHDYQDACVDKLERFIRGEPERPELRSSPGLRALHGPLRLAGSRGQSPARRTPVASPLPRRPRRYQARLASPTPMPRSRSVDAILDTSRPDSPQAIAQGRSQATGRQLGGGVSRQNTTDSEGDWSIVDQKEADAEPGAAQFSSQLSNASTVDEPDPSALQQVPPPSSATPSLVSAVPSLDSGVPSLDPGVSFPDPSLTHPNPDVPAPDPGPPSEMKLPKPSQLPRRGSGPNPSHRPLPALVLSAPSQDGPQSPVLLCSKSPLTPSRSSPVARRIQRRSEQTSAPTTPTVPEWEPSISEKSTRRSEMSRQSRLRKSNMVERALTKVRSAITKENK